MFKDTQRRINEYKAMLPDVKGRIVAAALALIMSVAMLASTTYAWLTISRAPEVKGMSTTVSGNGNLEIALVPADGSLPGDATGAENSLLASNVTWGNLVNLSDAGYGLDLIELRPALLSQYNLATTPLYGATYGEDGRVTGSSDKYRFASYAVAEDGTKYFLATDAENPRYGVRAITSITYSNVNANAALNALQAKITNGYGTATQKYKSLIGTGDGSDSTIIYGEGSTAIRAIPALQMIMELYVNEQAKNVLGSYTQDYSGVVTYAYYLMDAFLDVLEAEGEALTSLANMQIYKTDNSLGTSYYQNFAALYTAYKTNKMHSAVKLESLKTLISNYDSISGALANDPNKDRDLYDLAMACDPDTVAAGDRPTVVWSELSPYVAKLVDIGTVTIEHGSDKVTIGSLGGSSISPLLNLANKADSPDNPATATITKGALKETEARLGAWLRESGLVISIYVDYMGVGDVYAYVVTNVDPQKMTLSGKDQETVENMTNEGADDQGEAVANDTYGMAIDLWARTNVSDVVMTLEGSLVTEKVIATGVNKNGEETTLYVMSISTTETSTVYGITSDGVTAYYTYDAETDTMSQIGDSESMKPILGYEFTKTGSTKTVGEATYTEYTMTQKMTTNNDVYVVENVERWYTTDGVLVGAVETLENDSRYAFTATSETVTVDGQELTVYTMEYTDTSTNETTTAKVYKVAEALWYKAENHEELGTDAQLREDGATFTEKMEDIVIGYDGINRVWKDYLALIESGFMLENNTTQGAGSCYVFYADPSEQNRILHLLEAFTVVFIDDAGNKLGTAKLDTEHYYSINGKTTVPLKLIAGTTYLDENGNQQYGITALQKNKAARVSAIVYLDGTRLSNADVLAVGEIEGTLNLQFGSSIPLNNQDDVDLRFQFRDLEAVATYNGQTSASSGQPISLEYNKDGHEVTVTLTVDGTQPKTIQGFFIRSISKSQGTKGQTVNFVRQDGDTWTATFNLTTPGTYIMRSLIVDGAEYALDDGTKDAENGVVTDSFPTVKIAGLGIASVHVEGLNRGITMTADHSVTAEVTVGINADASLMPKQVRALFRSNTGKEFTALLSNTGTGNSVGASVWKGTADITESGEYVLQYVYIDGVPFDLAEIWSDQAEEDPTKGQFTYIIYLGLTTKVWATGKTEFDFTGPTNVGFQLRIYDGNGNELNALDDVWLYYHSEGSVLDQDGMYAQVRWDSSSKYYVGTLPLNSGGNFLFNRVVTNRSNDSSRSTITRASSAPVISAIVKDPPEYVGNWTDSYQFVPSGGATMTVQLENARTADVWALITNGTDIYMVPKAALESTDGVDKYIFHIPADSTQDGQWEMLALYMWRCANSEGDWLSAGEAPVTNGFIKLNKADGATVWTVVGTDATVDPADFFILDMTDKDVGVYVVQTVYASVNGADSLPLSEIKFGNVGFGFEDTNKNGKFDSGETVTSTFMDSHNTGAVTFVITDWNGNALDDSLTVSVAWTSKYDKSYSAAYGGYTTEYLHQDVQVDLTQTANNNGVVTHTLAAQTYQLAGMHTTQFAVKVDGTTIATIQGDTISVCSKAPTVTIKDITLDGGNAYAVDLTETGHICDTYKNTGSTCSPNYHFTINSKHIFAADNTKYLTRIEDDNRTAWLYFKCNHSKTTKEWDDQNLVTYTPHDYSYANGTGVPAATLELTNMGYAASAELTFAKTGGGDVIMVTQYTAHSDGYWGDVATYGTDSYAWTKDGNCQRFIGVMNNKAGENNSGTKTVAGTITASVLVLKDANGNEYYFNIPAITIHNPY